MTSTYLLDTDTFRYIANGASQAARTEFQRRSQDRESVICISALTEAEVRFGMAKQGLSRSRRAAIEGLFANLQILSWGTEEAAAYAEARATLEAKGLRVSTMDMLIAAHAIAADAALVSPDKIFAKIGKATDLFALVNWATDLQVDE